VLEAIRVFLETNNFNVLLVIICVFVGFIFKEVGKVFFGEIIAKLFKIRKLVDWVIHDLIPSILYYVPHVSLVIAVLLSLVWPVLMLKSQWPDFGLWFSEGNYFSLIFGVFFSGILSICMIIVFLMVAFTVIEGIDDINNVLISFLRNDTN